MQQLLTENPWLIVIGLGVLVATAAKGGQASVTNVTAEPTSEGNTAAVRVSIVFES